METRKTTGFTSAESAALMAQLGSVSRLNPDHFYAEPFSFVPDKALKLKEAPITYPVVHSFSKSSFTYSFEVFQYYPTTIKSENNALADVVINPSHEPLLSATKLPFNLLNFKGVEEPAIAGNGKIVNSEVNAENTFLQSNSINLFRETEQEISLSFFINPEKAFSELPTFEVFDVTSRNFDAEFLSAFEQPQSENISFKTGGTWKVVADADRSLANYGLAFGFLDNAACLLDTSHSKLCWQGLSQPLVNEWVQFNIIPDLAQRK